MPVFAKASALALASLSLSPAIPESYVITSVPQIKFVACMEGTGTAVQVEGNRFASVNHVTGLHACHIDGAGIQIEQALPEQDFSILAAPRMTNGLRINCGGYRDGETYWAIGFAEGLPWQRVRAVHGTDHHVVLRPGTQPLAVMIGERFIPGMSGGAVVNSRWEIVGMVNALSTVFSNISFSRELKDTPLCRA
jgi:hypothetical protein